MRSLIVSSIVVLGACGMAAGQDVPKPRPILIPPPPAPAPAAVPENVGHMLKAAGHLEAAGLDNEAEAIRRRAEHAMKSLQQSRLEKQLAHKLTQLQQLQQEIDDLRRRAGKVQQVEFRVQFLEADLQKLRSSRIELDGFSAEQLATLGLSGVLQAASQQPAIHSAGTTSPVAIVKQGKKLETIIAQLKRKKVLKVLAEPTIVTTDRRPAVYQSGGEFPILVPTGHEENTIEWREFGARLEVVPEMKSGGKIRVEMSCELAERDDNNALQLVGGTVPALTTSRFNTQVEMRLGQTVILGGMRTTVEDDGRKTATERIVLLTPKRVDESHKDVARQSQ